MGLNNPETTLPPCPWKNCLPWSRSLVPKRSWTTDINSKFAGIFFSRNLGVSCVSLEVSCLRLDGITDPLTRHAWVSPCQPFDIRVLKASSLECVKTSILEHVEAWSLVTPAQNSVYLHLFFFQSPLPRFPTPQTTLLLHLLSPVLQLLLWEGGCEASQSPHLAALPVFGNSAFGLLPVSQNEPGSGMTQCWMKKTWP